jgi:hypothetical protein
MTTSGTYDFSPSVGSLVLGAFDRIQLRPTALLAEHMARAGVECNLLLSEWANRGVNLWKSELQQISLTQGVSTYTLPTRTVNILVGYISITTGGITTDRILNPISTFEYGALPQKQTQGPPTIYWFNRQIAPQMTLWPVPDNGGPYTMKLQTMVQVQDANLPAGETPDIPYRWYDCFTAGLAYRLARIYTPQLEQIRKADYNEAWGFAASEDTEDVPVYIYPALGQYWR